jgi:hypothetical protein
VRRASRMVGLITARSAKDPPPQWDRAVYVSGALACTADTAPHAGTRSFGDSGRRADFLPSLGARAGVVNATHAPTWSAGYPAVARAPIAQALLLAKAARRRPRTSGFAPRRRRSAGTPRAVCAPIDRSQ